MPNNRYTNSSLSQTPVTGPFGFPLKNSDGSDNEIRVARKAGRYTLAIKSDNAWRYFDESLKAATVSELGTIKVGDNLEITQDGVLSATGGGSGDVTGVTLTSDSGTASDTTGNVDLTIAGGTAIGTTATGATVTINNAGVTSNVAGTGIGVSGATGAVTITCNLEGTELISTGETGTAKFLRVDGDGSCSWQTPSYVANTDVDVSIANLKTRLAGGFGSNAVTIGDGDDVVTIAGNLVVSGTYITADVATISVEDPLFELARANPADLLDVGFYAKYVDSGTKYTGLFRDASDADKWKLFDSTGNSHEAPTTTVNTTSGFALGYLIAATFEGALVGNSDTTTLATNATNVVVAAESTDTTCFPLFALASSGNQPPKANTNFSFNSSTAVLTASGFAGNATSSTTVTVTDNENTDEENLITFVAGAATATGVHGLEMDGNATYNPSTGKITATGFTGTASKVTVTDSTADTAFAVVFHDGSDALLDDTGTLTYNPNDGAFTAHTLKIDASATSRIYVANEAGGTTPSVGTSGQAIISYAASGAPYWGNPIPSSSGSEGRIQLSGDSGVITSSPSFEFGELDASPLVLTYAGNMNITGAFEVKNGSTSAGYINFYEDSSNGTNKVTLIGPASTADITLTLPSAAGTIIGTGNSTSITSVGTITAGVWNSSTVIASAYLDADTAHLSGTQTFSGAKTFSSNLTLSANLVITGYKITANTSAGAGAGVGTAGNALLSYGAGGGVYWGTPTSGPAGSTEHVQYNAGGAMAGEANFKWEYAENNLAIDGSIEANQIDLGTQTNSLYSYKVNNARFGGHADSITDVLYNAYWAGSAWVNDDDSKDSFLFRLMHDVGLEYNVAEAAATPTFVKKFSINKDGDGVFLGSVTWSGGSSTNANTAYTHSQVSGGVHATGTVTSVATGGGLTGGTVTTTGTISHSDTSSQASVDNSGRTYIQDITLDTYGHITAITSATESVTDTNTQCSVTDSVSTTSSSTRASATAVKSAYDRTWRAVDYVNTAGTSHASCGANTTYLTPSSTASSLTSVGTLTALTGGTGDLIWDTPTFVVDSSADRVGIGTASPATLLHLQGATSTGANGSLRIEGGSGSGDGGGAIDFYNNSVHQAGIYGARVDASTGKLYFRARTSSSIATALTLQGGNATFAGYGEFGGQVYTVDGSAGAPAFLFTGDSNTGMYRKDSDVIAFSTGGTERVSISAGGLGTDFNIIVAGEVAIAQSKKLSFDTDKDSYIIGAGANQIDMYVGGTKVLQLTAANFIHEAGDATFVGRVSLGAQSNSAKNFHVNNARFGGHHATINDVLYNAWWDGSASAWYKDEASYHSSFIRQDSAGLLAYAVAPASSVSFVNVFTVNASGAGTFTGDVTAYYSDARLKDFHGVIENPLDKVMKLNGYYFTENSKAKELGFENDRMQVGVSAQEIEEVMPELIKDAPIGHGYKTIDYGKLTPLLIEAIKELKMEINELKGIA